MDIEQVHYPAPQFAMTPRSLADVTDLIVHHTAGSLTQTPLEIDQEHRNIGDAMIAYNFVITPDGKVHEGRPVSYVPAAAYGRNAQSVNVVLVGQFQPDAPNYTGPPTAAQLDALLQFGIWVHRELPSIVRTIGHCNVAPMFYPQDTADYATDCPGKKLIDQLPSIKARIARALNVH